MKKICIVNNDFSLFNFFISIIKTVISLFKKNASFETKLNNFLSTKHCFLTSSGFCGLYIILKSLKELYPDKTEVIIPAYGPSGLTLPIKKLGLTVKICDISLKTFNIDVDLLNTTVTNKTLAIITVHLFGIPVDLNTIENIAENKGCVLIEDCAQSMGTQVNHKSTGARSKLSIGSFARGKNFSLYHGGYIALNSDDFKDIIEKNYNALPEESLAQQIKNLCRFIIFSIIIHPYIYALFYKIISALKTQKEKNNFSIAKINTLTKKFGNILFDMWLKNHNKRIENGLILYEKLKSNYSIILPAYSENNLIAFNRFPILIKNIQYKKLLLNKFDKLGIETSYMYKKAVPEIINYNETFSNASYFAEHLLTFPLHGYVDKKIINTIIKTIWEKKK